MGRRRAWAPKDPRPQKPQISIVITNAAVNRCHCCSMSAASLHLWQGRLPLLSCSPYSLHRCNDEQTLLKFRVLSSHPFRELPRSSFFSNHSYHSHMYWKLFFLTSQSSSWIGAVFTACRSSGFCALTVPCFNLLTAPSTLYISAEMIFILCAKTCCHTTSSS